VQPHVQPIARLDCGDLLVVAVEDHALAAAVAGIGIALPPGEDGLTLQLLNAEVSNQRVPRDREWIEPHEAALRIENHRAVLTGTELGSHKDVSFARRGMVLRHGNGGRLEIPARAERAATGAEQVQVGGDGDPISAAGMPRNVTWV
jgi:hypothetical protein